MILLVGMRTLTESEMEKQLCILFLKALPSEEKGIEVRRLE
jgi:hypothetical protein